MLRSNSRRSPSWPLVLLLWGGACSTRKETTDAVTSAACVGPTISVDAEFLPVRPDSTKVRLAEITRAEVARDGELIVLDGTGPALFRIDSSGGVTVLLDRKGRGPGELADPRAFAIGPSGEIAVLTPDPPQVALFDSTGRFVRTVRYWRAAMATDAAFDAEGSLVVSYRGVRLADRLGGADRFATVERLRLGDSVTAQAIMVIDSAVLNGPPYFRAPIIETFVGAARSGRIAATGNLFYNVALLADGTVETRMDGCTDGVDNAERLRNSTPLEGGYTLLGAEVSWAPDGTLWRLTPAIRKADGRQRLDRWRGDGSLLSSWLLPSAATGGHYLTAVFPTADSTRLWGYEAGGELYHIRVSFSAP